MVIFDNVVVHYFKDIGELGNIVFSIDSYDVSAGRRMCKNCNIIKILFDAAAEDAHQNYAPLLSFLETLERQNRVELFAGDCLLKDAVAVMSAEKHYTVCHYLKCTCCGQIFFIGACIRGMPIYKLIDDINNENLSNMIWGDVGTKYNMR